MSHIEELIEELCPDGVEYLPLGKVGKFIRGSGIQKKDLRESGVPAIHYGQIHTKYGLSVETTISFIDDNDAKKRKKARPGDLLIATTSEDDAAVAKATAWMGESDVCLSGDAYIFRHSLDPKYMSFFFSSEFFEQQKHKYITGAKVRRISGDSMSRILIPVPPLEVQREIVRILDQFTQLEARRQQYVYYRDTLLDFSESESVTWCRMSDIGEIFGGLTGKSKSDFLDGNARFVSYVNVFNNISADFRINDYVSISPGERQRTLKLGDVLFTGSSESVHEVGMTSVVTGEPEEPVYLNSFCIGYRLNPDVKLLPGFSKYLFRSSQMRKQIVSTANGVTRFNISKKRLGCILVPIPDLKYQKEVSEILDQFDALTNDLASGLPAEIEARRKQYEYYRDKLLTFKEKVA